MLIALRFAMVQRLPTLHSTLLLHKSYALPTDLFAPEGCLLQYQELLAGFVRLHILHHAAEGEIYGVWIIEELGRHGYRLSPGTLYPMLHTMERKGYLRSRQRRSGRSIRRLYRTTALGEKALKASKEKLRELVGELIEGE
jgi:DNA-binding PadR family transcriptional regulator